MTLGVASHLPFNGGLSLFKVSDFCSVFYHLTYLSVHSFCHSTFHFYCTSYSDGWNTYSQPFPSVLQDHYIVYQGLFLCVQVDVEDLRRFLFYPQEPLLFDYYFKISNFIKVNLCCNLKIKTM